MEKKEAQKEEDQRTKNIQIQVIKQDFSFGGGSEEFAFSIVRMRVSNKSWTALLCLAVTSTKRAFMYEASSFPSSTETALSLTRSVLFPTKTIGALFINRSSLEHEALNYVQEYLLYFSSQINEFVIQDSNNFKALLVINAVHETESIDIHCVLSRENRVLILSCSINQLKKVLLSSDLYLLREGCE